MLLLGGTVVAIVVGVVQVCSTQLVVVEGTFWIFLHIL